jgi:hypothetical protein
LPALLPERRQSGLSNLTVIKESDKHTTPGATPASPTLLCVRLVFRTINLNGWTGLAAIPKVPGNRNDLLSLSEPDFLSAVDQK